VEFGGGETAKIRTLAAMPRLAFHTDPADFLAEAGKHLAADPVVSTVVSTTAERAVAEDAAGIASDAPYRWWLVVRDDAGEVVGGGMRTAPFQPYPLFLLPMPTQAAVMLARELHDRGEPVAGVNGALPAAEECAAELARLTGGRVDVEQHTRLHRADVVAPPAPAPGRLRPATDDDLELALAWFEDFAAAADEQAGRPPGSHHVIVTDPEVMLRRIRNQEVWLWEDEAGRPVHLTAHHPPSFGVARVAPVYTPAEHRGRGYAGSAVAAVSQRILDAGAVPCLYTDQANPTSNKLYAAVGYVPVVDMVNLQVLTAAADTGDTA
jgi:GNAT superfamily N-acetyltransferase